MKTISIAAVAILVAGCGLTPKQLQALDGAMCTRIYGATTTIVGGASKTGVTQVDGTTCSITTVNEPREGPPTNAPTGSRDAKL